MNPRDIKFLLAEEIAARFHHAEAAKLARENFVAQFQKGKLPDAIPEIKIPMNERKEILLPVLIKELGFAGSNSEAKRLIRSGAVRLDGVKILDEDLIFGVNKTIIIQVGKLRFAKVMLI